MLYLLSLCLFFFSSRRRHTRYIGDWSSDVCSSDLFTVAHDPTERDRQGPDVGSQYRSVVFYGTPEQHAAAAAMIAALERETAYPRPIVTEVVPLERFYPAEAYHQDYLAHHATSPYIVYNDLPKLKQLEARFPKLYRP